MRVLAITGPPCSGKSTMAAFLSSAYRTPVLCTGVVARRLTADRKDQQEQHAMSSGLLFPDEHRLRSHVDTWIAIQERAGHQVVIIDGAPRSVDQVAWLKYRPVKILILDATPQETLNRFIQREGRRDDAYHAKRLDLWYANRADIMNAAGLAATVNVEDLAAWLRPVMCT